MYGAMFPGTKSPLCLDCLWISFLMEKQTGLMSPMPLLPHPILCSSHKEDTFILLFFNQGLLGYIQVWACVVSSALYHLLTLPKPSGERPASSRPGLEFVSTQSGSTYPFLPPLSQHFGYFPVTVLFLMTHLHTHQPRDPKLLRAVTFS